MPYYGLLGCLGSLCLGSNGLYDLSSEGGGLDLRVQLATRYLQIRRDVAGVPILVTVAIHILGK